MSFTATRERLEGVTSRSGSPVYWGDEQVRPSWNDTLIRAAGFNPSNISEKRERQWKEYKIKSAYDDIRAEIYRQIRLFAIKPSRKQTRAEWAAILEAVEAYNARVKRQGHEFVPEISERTLKGTLTRASGPNPRERGRR